MRWRSFRRVEQRDAPAGKPPVGLELRLPRAACTDTAAEPLQVLPHAAHARQVVLELRELHLQLALGRDRVLRENVQVQLCPVDDARIECVFEVALLRRVELVVDDHTLGTRLAEARLQLLELALADVGPLRRACAPLDDRADRLHARGAGEFLDFGQLAVGVDTLSQHREDEPALGLRGTCDHCGRLCPVQPSIHSSRSEPSSWSTFGRNRGTKRR